MPQQAMRQERKQKIMSKFTSRTGVDGVVLVARVYEETCAIWLNDALEKSNEMQNVLN